MSNFKFVTGSFLVLFFCLFFTSNSFAKKSFADLNKGSFYKTNKVKQFFSLGGGYKSDHNSKEYEVLSGYRYKSKKFLHEIDFLHEATYASTTRIPIRKTEELYDFELSSRMMIENSKNYLNLYHRTQYDEFSKFYYDISSAVGVGRLFLNNHVESSLSFGYNENKNTNSEIILIGILKGKIKITDSIKFATRGLLERKEKTYDEEIKNILSFRIQKNLFFELIHRYEKNRFVNSTRKLGEHRVSRTKREIYARFKYSF